MHAAIRIIRQKCATRKCDTLGEANEKIFLARFGGDLLREGQAERRDVCNLWPEVAKKA
jgi:hypothetical protein